MKKINQLITSDEYKWKYNVVGGVTRVNIETGEDLAHLPELDQKLWTVLSCPVQGLEFDERTLSLMDSDGDGKIRVNEVVAASKWLTKVLKNMELLTEKKDTIALSEINADSEEGQQVLDAAHLILKRLGLDKEEISLSDVISYIADYEAKCREEFVAPELAMENTGIDDNIESLVNAVREKIADYFMRCRLLQFDGDAAAVLDVQVDKIAAISGNNLSASIDEIASYPIARPRADAVLNLTEGINPAWMSQMAALKTALFPNSDTINEAQWSDIVAKVDSYTAAKSDHEAAKNETINSQIATYAAAIEPVERLLRYLRDFLNLTHNFVVMSDFYRRDKDSLAVFQAGTLFIDQRQCDLCIKVTDMAKQTMMAGLSGIYLLYCHCISKTTGLEFDIVAALTDGDVDGLREGKNAIFYDRQGHDYDAVVTKIIDNPISIRQAFWSPYRKFGNWVTDKINKSAAEKESKQFDEMTSKAEATTTDLSTKVAAGQSGDAAATTTADANTTKQAPFDIAKFAGIFAAIGMGLGMIGAALAGVFTYMSDKWYNTIIIIAVIMIVISGPSMLLAYLKLRKRNLGPILNANGWAINSMIKINMVFGATLTSIAKYPKLVMKDPFADKKTPWWKKTLRWIVFIAIVVFCVMYFTKSLPWQKKSTEAADKKVVDSVNVEVVENNVPADTTAVVE